MKKGLFLLVLMSLLLGVSCTEDDIYTISFESNGGSLVEKIESSKNLTVVLPTSSKLGYTFDGWYTSNEFTYEFDMYTLLTADIILYAKWTLIEYDIIYHLDGGELDDECPLTYTIETDMPVGIARKDGYTFLGWQYGPLRDTYFIEITPGMTGNIDLNAHFMINAYTAYFDPMNGEDEILIDYEFGQWISAPDDPIKAGYQFIGWYDEHNQPFYEHEATSDPLHFFAHYSAITYSVTYHFEGGSQEYMTHYDISYNANDTLTEIPGARRDGYVFVGWYTNPEGIGEPVTHLPSTLYRNLDLYAQWTYLTYTITFDSMGGSLVNPIEYPVMTPDKPPLPTPTKEGYTFGGWYRDQACSTPFTYPPSIIGGDLTVYAKWIPIT